MNAVIKNLKINGLASKKTIGDYFWNYEEFKEVEQKIVLDFLKENNYTIASSCNGEGKCKKCVINNDLLSCQVKLKTLFEQNNFFLINISYL